MAFIDDQTVLTDPGLEEPADIVQDAFGNWLYIPNAAGHWYNNPAFGSSAPAGDPPAGDPPAGDPPAGDLFSDQANYSGLRAQPHPTDADGTIQGWGIQKKSQGK